MISHNSDLFQAIDALCKRHTLLPHNATIILGLSGGPDSMMLLHYLQARREANECNLIAAHLNHEWRVNSQNDVEFCAEQTEKLGVRLISSKISELSFKPKFNGSKEDLGRLFRRHFLQSVKEQEGADFIALAHQMQDQQETFFIRMIRGSSLTGLTAMQPRQGCYIRPLLEISRADIIAYLENNKIPYLIDPSNESDLFLRNRLRNKVLPMLRSIDKRFDHNFARTLTQLKETDEFLDELTIHTLRTISSVIEGKLTIQAKEFNLLHPILKKRILIAWLIHEQVPFTPTEHFLLEIINFMTRPAGKEHQLHTTWSINKKHGQAIIIKRS
jgi:tRNA(Ile)-lysidine synthase